MRASKRALIVSRYRRADPTLPLDELLRRIRQLRADGIGTARFSHVCQIDKYLIGRFIREEEKPPAYMQVKMEEALDRIEKGEYRFYKPKGSQDASDFGGGWAVEWKPPAAVAPVPQESLVRSAEWNADAKCARCNQLFYRQVLLHGVEWHACRNCYCESDLQMMGATWVEESKYLIPRPVSQGEQLVRQRAFQEHTVKVAAILAERERKIGNRTKARQEKEERRAENRRRWGEMMEAIRTKYNDAKIAHSERYWREKAERRQRNLYLQQVSREAQEAKWERKRIRAEAAMLGNCAIEELDCPEGDSYEQWLHDDFYQQELALSKPGVFARFS